MKIIGKHEEEISVEFNGSYISILVEEDGNGNSAQILLYEQGAQKLIDAIKNELDKMRSSREDGKDG